MRGFRAVFGLRFGKYRCVLRAWRRRHGIAAHSDENEFVTITEPVAEPNLHLVPNLHRAIATAIRDALRHAFGITD